MNNLKLKDNEKRNRNKQRAMREVKFKARKVNNDEWIEGSLILTKDGRAHIVGQNSNPIQKETSGNWYINAPCFQVEAETVCQFTGLTDKNGVNIWEGDILEIEGMKFTVSYLDGSFRLIFSNNRNRGMLYQERADKLEVIGNIHRKEEEK